MCFYRFRRLYGAVFGVLNRATINSRDEFDPFLSNLTFPPSAKPINLTENEQKFNSESLLKSNLAQNGRVGKAKFKRRNDDINPNLPQLSLQKLIYFCRIKRAFALFHRLSDEESEKLVLAAFILGDLVGVRA